MVIEIKEITKDHWYDAIKLTVKKEQENYVASNAISLAQSKFQPEIKCYGIFHDDTMVGFSAFGKNSKDNTVWLVRHMVGANFQGKGFGKAGLKGIIQFMKKKYSCSEIYLDVADENIVAITLYKKAGFKKTNKRHPEGFIYKLDLTKYNENF